MVQGEDFAFRYDSGALGPSRGWDAEGGGRGSSGGRGHCVWVSLIHADVWQKATKDSKTIILQLKNITYI